MRPRTYRFGKVFVVLTDAESARHELAHIISYQQGGEGEYLYEQPIDYIFGWPAFGSGSWGRQDENEIQRLVRAPASFGGSQADGPFEGRALTSPQKETNMYSENTKGVALLKGLAMCEANDLPFAAQGMEVSAEDAVDSFAPLTAVEFLERCKTRGGRTSSFFPQYAAVSDGVNPTVLTIPGPLVGLRLWVGGSYVDWSDASIPIEIAYTDIDGDAISRTLDISARPGDKLFVPLIKQSGAVVSDSLLNAGNLTVTAAAGAVPTGQSLIATGYAAKHADQARRALRSAAGVR